MGSIPVAGEEKIRCPNMFSFVSFAWMTLDKSVRRFLDRDVNWSLKCRESQALKERHNESYAKRAVTSFFKSYPCANFQYPMKRPRGRAVSAGGEILPEPKRRFIAQSLSCSPFHRLEMTEILLKGRKNPNSSIHQYPILQRSASKMKNGHLKGFLAVRRPYSLICNIQWNLFKYNL